MLTIFQTKEGRHVCKTLDSGYALKKAAKMGVKTLIGKEPGGRTYDYTQILNRDYLKK